MTCEPVCTARQRASLSPQTWPSPSQRTSRAPRPLLNGVAQTLRRCRPSLILLLIITRFSSLRGLGVLQQLLNDTLPFFPICRLPPPVTCQSHRVETFTYLPIFAMLSMHCHDRHSAGLHQINTQNKSFWPETGKRAQAHNHNHSHSTPHPLDWLCV